MPDPQQNATGTPAPPPDPNAANNSPTHYYDSDSKSIKKMGEDKPETLGQRVWRNLTPKLDTSNAAKGPGHEWDSEPSPQKSGEELYKENFGSPLEQAYGHAKRFLQTGEKNLSEKVLQPFREGVDRIGDELQQAGETGHTKSGGQLTGPTRALVGTVGELMKQVPVGRDVKSTVQAMAVPPELGPEGKINLEGIEHIEISPAPKPGAKGPNLEGIEHVEISPAPKVQPRSIFTPEGAKPLADKIGAKVVGSVATGKTSPDPYGINRGPKDLDLRIDGEYDHEKTKAAMREQGFEPTGSSVVSPEEVKKSGKDYGGAGWKRIQHFENAAGHKVDIFHDADGMPASKAKERAANLKNLGIGLTKMDPNDAKNWVGYTNQKSLKVYRGVDDPSHSIEAGDYVTTSKESAQNYGKHVQEVEASPEELRYVRGHQNGDPKRVGQGGQTELIYAPKKSAAKPAPKNPTHEKLFADATAALGPETKKTAAKTTLNASGESSASQEAINRAASEKAQGIKRYRIDGRSGKEIPLFGPDAVDAKAGPFDYIVSRDSKGQTVLDMGSQARPLRTKR